MTHEGAQLVRGGGPPIIGCIIRDLSQTGACLELDGSVHVSTSFTLVFDCDGAMKACRVVWRSRDRTGVRFLKNHETGSRHRAQ